MATVNIEELSKSSEELMTLITKANTTLGLPQSHLRADFQNSLTSSSTRDAVAALRSKVEV